MALRTLVRRALPVSAIVTLGLTSIAAWPAAAAPAGGTFLINGAVAKPVTVSVSELRALKTQTADVSFIAGTTPQSHRYRGVALADVIALASPTTPAGGKNPILRQTVTVKARDGYQVSLALGEADSGFGNKNVLVAFEEDGKDLSADGPRLVTPGDVKGGRYVSAVTSLTVGIVAAPAAATVPAGGLRVNGAVTTPTTFTYAELAALPQVTRTVTFGSGTGSQTHEETGPLLKDVLAVAGPAPTANTKNSVLRLVATATASDGYQATVSLGEAEPDFGNVPIMVSLIEDSVSLDGTGPRLVVPGDVKGGRYASATHTITVADPTATETAAPSAHDARAIAASATGDVVTAGIESAGGLTGVPLAAPVVGVAARPQGDGYWLAAADGGVFAFGKAGYFGSMGGRALASPIVAVAATPTGAGYWLAAADGGVFAFGDARFFGSTAALTLVSPIVAMASSASGAGYLLIAADGGVFAFGDARFFGSTGGIALVAPVVAAAPTPSGKGYWLAAADGGVFAFGDAAYLGSGAGASSSRTIALVGTAGGTGYRVVRADGTTSPFGTVGALNLGGGALVGAAG